MITIGTAGHIDHGKSSLVKFLTSVDPDRLPEEKERGMTIDLGFAFLTLSSGEKVGIVDVPGHKHFVHNVIPGLYGIDAVLLVVAADDGWMPQTEEHVHIIDLLGLKHAIVAITKTDLAGDKDWLELVEKDVRQQLSSTTLAGAPIVRVSNKDGTGFEELKQLIEQMVAQLKARRDINKPRLPVDRVFMMKGSGVVVTGTLNYGCLSAGEEVIIAPEGKKARIRGVQSYGQKVDRAYPGSRGALNLTGIKREELKRGDIIITAASELRASRVIDAEVKLLPGFKLPLRSGSEVDTFFETRRLAARVMLLEGKTIQPGQKMMAQLRLSGDISTYVGERFIIRRQSPPQTIGGGLVLDPFAERHKVADFGKVVTFLKSRQKLELDSLIVSELEKYGYVPRRGLLKASYFSEDAIAENLSGLLNRGKAVVAGSYLVSTSCLKHQVELIIKMLSDEHKEHPLGRGLSQAELMSRLGLPEDVFLTIIAGLADSERITISGEMVALAGFKAELSAGQQKLVKDILDLVNKDKANPPRGKELLKRFEDSQTVVTYLIRQGELVELPEGIILSGDYYREIKQKIVEYLNKNGQITIQDLNSLFGFSRKYSVPLLTQLDREKVTRRQGNVRVSAK